MLAAVREAIVSLYTFEGPHEAWGLTPLTAYTSSSGAHALVVELKAPPRIKVLEALGAIADGRVKIVGPGRAEVVSSEGDRVYKVYVDLEQGLVYSDDNGTRLRGYVGYPIIALLMMMGVVSFDEKVAKALRGIPWRKLNEQYGRYALVEREVKRIARIRGVGEWELDLIMAKVLSELKKLKLKRLNRPPEEKGSDEPST